MSISSVETAAGPKETQEQRRQKRTGRTGVLIRQKKDGVNKRDISVAVEGGEQKNERDGPAQENTLRASEKLH